jgi:hypothetical protein
MSSTDVAVRGAMPGFDLTRAPAEQWDKQMLEMVAKNVFRGVQVTEMQLYFCLSIAESLDLNPMIGEIYYIPGKSDNGKGPALIPYIGRNGLVKKARQRTTYYESDTVHANDKFRMVRKADGQRTVTHSYGATERGPIIGAYAFLHDRNGVEEPAFFYAELEEYLPTFDADWKMSKSPWGNQRSAMIEKCAMIGAGRKRLDLGNVLADGEIERVQQMQEIGPPTVGRVSAEEQAEFSFDDLTDDAELALRLQLATTALEWPPAKCDMALAGQPDERLREIADQLDAEVEKGEVVDAEVVTPEVMAEDFDAAAAEVRADGLRGKIADLTEQQRMCDSQSEEWAELDARVEQLGAELAAISNPDQGELR